MRKLINLSTGRGYELWSGTLYANIAKRIEPHRNDRSFVPWWIHDGSAYFASRFRQQRRHVSFYRSRGIAGPIGCFQFSVGALEGDSTVFVIRGVLSSLVRKSGMNRDGRRIAEWTEGREIPREVNGYERKSNTEWGSRWEEGKGERVQRGHSSHDIKRGCRPLETRPTDSKDSGRSAMKSSSLWRNYKKIGKN